MLRVDGAVRVNLLGDRVPASLCMNGIRLNLGITTNFESMLNRSLRLSIEDDRINLRANRDHTVRVRGEFCYGVSQVLTRPSTSKEHHRSTDTDVVCRQIDGG